MLSREASQQTFRAQHIVVDWLDKHWTFFALVLCLVVQFLAYRNCSMGLPIRADGVGYYIYLPSWIMHQDVSLSKVLNTEHQGFVPPGTNLTLNLETGSWQNKFNAGVALFMLPFFLLAHWGSLLGYRLGLQSWAPDGYSSLYQLFASLAGSFYLVSGLSLLKGILQSLFTKQTVVLGLLSILLGTNVLHYGTGESVMSHAYSFFLFTTLLWLMPRWYEKAGSFWVNIALGLTMGAVLLIRPVNGISWIIWPLYGISSWGWRRTMAHWWQYKQWILLIIGMCVLTFLPQMYIWKKTFGAWFVNSYGDYGLSNWNNPAIGQVLFSVRKGILMYTPLTAVAFIGLFTMRKALSAYRLFIGIYFCLVLYVISSAAIWYAGGSFGQRYLMESWAFLGIPLCSTLETVRERRVWSVILAAVVIACISWNLFFMYLYYSREIPFEGLDAPAFFDVFWWRKDLIMQWIGEFVSSLKA
ncbi:MAG: hypothetical protein A2X46_05250 [Lentisphaerae bacterium GWF2_57_35]|nr:MAG: hypothetical protein A2X46_05250 [Lentisphaerae bacterium GWF2_57_35]